MSVSILSTLYNAEYNFKGKTDFQKEMASKQLHDAIAGLEEGIDPDDVDGFEKFLEGVPA